MCSKSPWLLGSILNGASGPWLSSLSILSTCNSGQGAMVNSSKTLNNTLELNYLGLLVLNGFQSCQSYLYVLLFVIEMISNPLWCFPPRKPQLVRSSRPNSGRLQQSCSWKLTGLDSIVYLSLDMFSRIRIDEIYEYSSAMQRLRIYIKVTC